jgi:hypothetical protein
MIYDKRLLDIAKLAFRAQKENDRRVSLYNVYFEKIDENNYIAIATDGHMLLKAEFPVIIQENYPSYESVIPDSELSEAFLVKGELIINAFKTCPKKYYLPILQFISIRANKEKSEVYATDMSSRFLAVYNYQITDYPNWRQVIPSEILPIDHISLSGQYLAFIGLMATNDNNKINLTFHGSAMSAMTFEIKCKDGLTITGLLMPLRESNIL